MTRRTLIALLAALGLLFAAPAIASAQDVTPAEGGHEEIAPPDVDVLPETDEELPDPAPDVEGEELAVTGADLPGLVGLALALLVFGAAAIVAARRIRRHGEHAA